MTDATKIRGLIDWALNESCKNNYENGFDYTKKEMFYKGYAKGVADTAMMWGIVVQVYHKTFEELDKLKERKSEVKQIG